MEQQPSDQSVSQVSQGVPPPLPAPQQTPGKNRVVLKIVAVIGALMALSVIIILVWGANLLSKLDMKKTPTPSPTAEASRQEADQDSFDKYLDISTNSKKYEALAQEAVNKLSAGDIQFLWDNLSPLFIGKYEYAIVEEKFLTPVQKYIAQNNGSDFVNAPSRTIQPADDGFGNEGFMIRYELHYEDGSKKLVYFWVVEIDGVLKIADVQ